MTYCSILPQGLSDLYDFKQKHSELDLNLYLRNASSFFKGYIERGLKMVEDDRSASAGGHN